MKITPRIRILRKLARLILSYDMNPHIIPREELFVKGIRIILEKAVKKGKIWA